MSLNFSQILEGSYMTSLKRAQTEAVTVSATISSRTVSHALDLWPKI